MFASNQDVSLLNTVTDDAKVIWKVFHERYNIYFYFNIEVFDLIVYRQVVIAMAGLKHRSRVIVLPILEQL